LPEVAREKGRIIVTNSADIPLKGLPFLLRAVSELTVSRAVHLVVVGELKQNGTVAKLIADLDLGSRITFTGRIDPPDFVREYARASVAVVPSVYEGFGLPAAEAMACGVPVISTAWVELLGFTEEQVGRVAGADLGGLSLGAVITALLVSRFTPKPPRSVVEMVERIRIPRGAGKAHEISV